MGGGPSAVALYCADPDTGPWRRISRFCKHLALMADARPASETVPVSRRSRADALPEILYTVYLHRVPGVVECSHGDVLKRVFLRDGAVIHASSTDRQDSLGVFLQRTGRIDAGEFTLTDQLRASSPDKRHGELLIEHGILSPQKLYEAIQEQIRSVVWSLFAWEAGEVTFSIGDFEEADMVRIYLPMRQVILQGVKRAPDAKALVARLGRKETQFEPIWKTEDLIEIAMEEQELAAAPPRRRQAHALRRLHARALLAGRERPHHLRLPRAASHPPPRRRAARRGEAAAAQRARELRLRRGDPPMALYEYQCLECGARSEVLQKMADAPLTTCTACGGPLKKLPSSPSVQFKGSGWYVTDYARKGGGGGKDAGGKEGGEKSGEGAKGEGKAGEGKAGEGKAGEGKSAGEKSSGGESKPAASSGASATSGAGSGSSSSGSSGSSSGGG